LCYVRTRQASVGRVIPNLRCLRLDVPGIVGNWRGAVEYRALMIRVARQVPADPLMRPERRHPPKSRSTRPSLSSSKRLDSGARIRSSNVSVAQSQSTEAKGEDSKGGSHRGARAAGASLRLVHQRLRYANPERQHGAACRAAMISIGDQTFTICVLVFTHLHSEALPRGLRKLRQHK
jgi:hypothetical protein